MPPSDPARVDVRFPAGERYSYGVVPYRRIDFDLPARPGLYSWHIRIPRRDPEAAAEFLHRLFVSETIEVSAQSNMRQTWKGPIQSTIKPFRDLDNPSLRDVFFALAYPIYIGISRNIARRLSTHKKELNEWRAADTRKPSLLGEERPETDTDEESRTFGRRLGAIFRDAGFAGTDWLYVKYYTPAHCELAATCGTPGPCLEATMAELRKAEWTCNTLFHPALGRR